MVFVGVRSYQAQDPVLSDIVAKIQAGTVAARGLKIRGGSNTKMRGKNLDMLTCYIIYAYLNL